MQAPWDASGNRAARAQRLGWYWNRLRCMTPLEWAHRTGRALQARAECWGVLRLPKAPPADFSAQPQPWIAAPPTPERRALIAAAGRIMQGRFDLFALRDVPLGTPPKWNRDPKTGTAAPLRFGKRLDYRDPALVGDIKYLWELNRHAHLLTLAQAYAASGARAYYSAIRVHLESWFAECPCPFGPNWSSALEAALRLIHWSAAWQMLGGAGSPLFHGADDVDFRARWLSSIYEHACFVRGFFSRHSSANNHLIGEAAGLFIAASTWPYWTEAARWLAEAREILEREALRQNTSDGVNREQATAYQRFELELLLCCWLADRANGGALSERFRDRIESMLEFVASLMDVAGNVPMIGDSDDARVLVLDHGMQPCGYRATLALGALLFRREAFKRKALALDERTRWLVPQADRAFKELNEPVQPLPVRRAFAQGGYYILGADFESDAEIRLIVDAGPLGYERIAAHGHADALAFWLSVGGLEFFVDPGTYAYHTHAEWRAYFRGSSAHNTLRVDGADQSRTGGAFMWVRKANAACTRSESTPDYDEFEGWHDGYMSLESPLMHRRFIRLEKRARRITIVDSIESDGHHEIELFFHCSERCEITENERGFEIRRGVTRLLLTLPQDDAAETHVYCGSVSPIQGWVSRRFDERMPAPAIVWRCRITGSASLKSVIAC